MLDNQCNMQIFVLCEWFRNIIIKRYIWINELVQNSMELPLEPHKTNHIFLFLSPFQNIWAHVRIILAFSIWHGELRHIGCLRKYMFSFERQLFRKFLKFQALIFISNSINLMEKMNKSLNKKPIFMLPWQWQKIA